MNYAIKYWKEKETNPIEFLNHFRCTTEPIGGGTEYDDDGELVDYDAAVNAIAIAKKDIINKACEWLRANIDLYTDIRLSFLSGYQELYLTDNFEKEFRTAMEK